MSDLAQRIIDGGGSVHLTYPEARSLAGHTDAKVRQALARHAETPPEILYYLATDAVSEVRRAAALNPSTPPKAYLNLAGDMDAEVRADLAKKIATITAGLEGGGRKGACDATYQTLDILASDQAASVRSILSDTLKDVAGAPPATIRQLALDVEIAVSGPVLEHSPVLSDDDLLEIIRVGPAEGGVGAISRRARVTERISDAVVETNDVEAIAHLLGNASAQIREETLDSLVDRAPDIELWHAPLVGRPRIPPRAVKKLAGFVASNLLFVLEARTDLDDETMDAVKVMVQRRVMGKASEAEENAASSKSCKGDFLDEDLPIKMATKLLNAGKLNNKLLSNAIQANDFGLVLAALAIRGGVEVDVVKKVFAAQSVKGVVALAWKAGLSMDLAVLMQQRMARVLPADVLTENDDGFPLGEADMAWQLEFYGCRSGNSSGAQSSFPSGPPSGSGAGQ